LTDSHPAQSYALTPIFFLRFSGSMLDPGSVTDAIAPCDTMEGEKRNPQTSRWREEVLEVLLVDSNVLQSRYDVSNSILLFFPFAWSMSECGPRWCIRSVSQSSTTLSKVDNEYIRVGKVRKMHHNALLFV
jgi:hypothetical protein